MRDEKGWIALAGRLLLAVIFFTSSIAKIFGFGSNVDYVRTRHLPAAGVLVACALAVELATWIALLTGIRARALSAVAFAYMIPVTLIFHTFLSTQFQKNLGIMGGLLMVAAHGPGKLALGRRKDNLAKMSG